jgi:hypothetical protein
MLLDGRGDVEGDWPKTHVALDEDLWLLGVNATGKVKSSNIVRRLLKLSRGVRNGDGMEVNLQPTSVKFKANHPGCVSSWRNSNEKVDFDVISNQTFLSLESSP